MARPEHLFVFAYDIEKDGVRAKVAERLDEVMTRVQLSVFEGRMSLPAARTLGKEIAARIGPDDSLRVYCLTEAARRASFVFGNPPLGEEADFWLA